MKRTSIIKSIIFAVAVLAVDGAWAATETVNGITWTYTVANGVASVGGLVCNGKTNGFAHT